jgi:hypothetical protein
MRNTDDFKKIIALVFIKAYKENNYIKSKTRLAHVISKDFLKQNILISYKSLLNYFNQFFGIPPDSFNPSEDVIEALLHYINFDSLKHFQLNQPTDKDYLNNVPFSLTLENMNTNSDKDSTTSLNKFDVFRNTLQEYYKTQEDFNYIRLIGDIEQYYSSLDIGTFFTDLSYIKKESIKNSNSLLTKEKSTYSTILRKERLNMSDKLAETIITNHKRIVVLGNPGSGKSVFSRHLCHKWAVKKFVSDDLYIHIILKKLEFSQQSKCIPKYVRDTYFNTISGVSDRSWLFPENTVFILDGFDEISNAHKKIMLSSLFEWVKDPKYVLLSRPYGILNQQISYDGFIEILGFNESTRLKYVSSLLKKSQKNLDAKFIANELDDNPQLVDISFNPLMLSYLVLIIINEGIEGIQNIRSIYGLQSKISGWLEYYYTTKPYKSKNYQESISKGEVLAYNMELNQEYICYRNLETKQYDYATELLNETGLGRKESFQNDASWRFYFSSATFQEFLAARAVLTKILPHHIMNLLKNQLYWNFTRMIIGGLNEQSEEKVNEVLDYVYYRYEKESNESIFRLYTILMAEASSSIIQKRSKELSIKKLVDSLFNSFELEGWSKLIIDATTTIYQKLSYKQEQWFLDRIVEKLRDHHVLKSDFNFDLYEYIVPKLSLYCDERFITSIMKLLDFLIIEYEAILLKLEELKEEESEELDTNDDLINKHTVEEDALVNIIGCSLELIGTATLSLLEPHKDIFERIGKNTLTFLNHTAVILNRMKSPDVLEQEFIENLNLIKIKLTANYLDIDEVYDAFKDYTPYHIGIYSIAIAKAFQHDNQATRDRISRLILKGYNLSKGILDLIEYDLEEDIGNFISALEKLKAQNYLEIIISLLSEYNLPYGMSSDDRPSLDALVPVYLEKYLQNTSDWQLFDTFFLALNFSKNGDDLFSYYYNTFCEIVISILESHVEELQSLFIENTDDSNRKLQSHKAFMTIDSIMNAPSWTFERQNLFRIIVNSKFTKYSFVEEKIIATLIKSGLSVTSKQVWQYIHKMSANADPKKILLLLDSEDIYEYQANYAEIIKVLKILIHKVELFTFEEAFFYSPYKAFHYIFYRIGFLLTKKFLSQVGKLDKESKEILPLLKKILLDANFVKMRYNNSYGYIDISVYKLFPLFMYELTGDKSIIATLSLSNFYQNEHSQGDDFDFYLSAAELLGIEILKKKYATILGEDNLKNIEAHYQEHIEFFKPVSTNELMALV